MFPFRRWEQTRFLPHWYLGVPGESSRLFWLCVLWLCELPWRCQLRPQFMGYQQRRAIGSMRERGSWLFHRLCLHPVWYCCELHPVFRRWLHNAHCRFSTRSFDVHCRTARLHQPTGSCSGRVLQLQQPLRWWRPEWYPWDCIQTGLVVDAFPAHPNLGHSLIDGSSMKNKIFVSTPRNQKERVEAWH